MRVTKCCERALTKSTILCSLQMLIINQYGRTPAPCIHIR